MKISEFKQYLVSLFSESHDEKEADEIIQFVSANVDFDDIDFTDPDAEITTSDALLFTFWYGILSAIINPEATENALNIVAEMNNQTVN